MKLPSTSRVGRIRRRPWNKDSAPVRHRRCSVGAGNCRAVQRSWQRRQRPRIGVGFLLDICVCVLATACLSLQLHVCLYNGIPGDPCIAAEIAAELARNALQKRRESKRVCFRGFRFCFSPLPRGRRDQHEAFAFSPNAASAQRFHLLLAAIQAITIYEALQRDTNAIYYLTH